jgi:6-pyruvoyltetrahydropterin/6-carboxytetrahydropterin synthase
MYELMVESTFDAAHQLIGYEGPCETLHGHTWKAQIYLVGEKLNKIGVLVDFKKLKADLQYTISKLDHTNLNTLPYFRKLNPTSENVAEYIYNEFAKRTGKGVKLTKVTVFESAVTSATYSR